MGTHFNLTFQRYLSPSDFANELSKLKAFRGAYYGDNLLESLEEEGLLRPRLRIVLPDPVARRIWWEGHDNVDRMLEPVEPDGTRWDALVSLDAEIASWSRRHVSGPRPHPLDNPAPSVQPFLQRSSDQVFRRWSERRVSVASNLRAELYDSCNIRDLYSTWQVLLAAEVADVGYHLRFNAADAATSAAVNDALQDGRAPRGTWTMLGAPVRALQEFVRHEAALDALVWFLEESSDALAWIVRGQGSGRFYLTVEQQDLYEVARTDLAESACRRFGVGTDEFVALARFLAERWVEWDDAGRPLVAEGYKQHLGAAVRFLRSKDGMSFEALRDEVGRVGGHNRPALDLIWPSWLANQKRRLRGTIRASTPVDQLSDLELDAFVEFVADERQDAIFLRLNSFEEHAFGRAEGPSSGMLSDLQGMAVGIEHAIRSMGGQGAQLWQMFAQLWGDGPVGPLVKKYSGLARRDFPPSEWPQVKAKIDALRLVDADRAITADLIMTHRLRGAVHQALPERDQPELERLLVGMLRAAALTHAHCKQRHTGQS